MYSRDEESVLRFDQQTFPVTSTSLRGQCGKMKRVLICLEYNGAHIYQLC